MSSKSYWHLSRSLGTQTGMTNDWLKGQGLIGIRDHWMSAHGYACTVVCSLLVNRLSSGPAC
jgi:RNA-directed DNA polymerase